MATLTSPVNKQNIIDRFADYVVANANASIVWGSDAEPFSEMPNANWGGTTGGRAIGINASNIGDTKITAATIRTVLEAETATFTNIRNLRAVLNVTGGGGNNGTRPTAGIVYDQTRKAHLNTSYRAAIGTPNNAGVAAGQKVDDANLETYFSNLRSAYQAVRDATVTIQVDVCHASCHSSCHGNRGRR